MPRIDDGIKEKIDTLVRTIWDDDNAYVIQKGTDELLVEDMLREQRLSYRITPHTRESLDAIVHAGPDVALDEEKRAAIVDRLLRLPQEVLISIRHVILVRNYEDLAAVIKECGLNDETIPDLILEDEDVLSDETIGATWVHESAVVINIHAIELAAKEVTEDRPGLYHKERDIGFWVTLLHELKHIQVECMPYTVPWINETDKDERAVEDWAIRTFEELF